MVVSRSCPPSCGCSSGSAAGSVALKQLHGITNCGSIGPFKSFHRTSRIFKISAARQPTLTPAGSTQQAHQNLLWA